MYVLVFPRTGPIAQSERIDINVSEWYEFARSTVERYQQEKLKEEEDQYQREREENLNLVKEEVEILEKKFQELSRAEFLKFIYTTHPPKKEGHKLGEVIRLEVVMSSFNGKALTDEIISGSYYATMITSAKRRKLIIILRLPPVCHQAHESKAR